MATDIATLAIKIDSTDTKKAERELDKLSTTGTKAENSVDRLSTSFKVGAVAAGAMAVAIGTSLVGGMTKAIMLASDLEETQGKFDVVFRGLTEQAEQWSSELVRSYAMSEAESKKYLSSLQDLLVPTGMARDAAAEMSNEMVKLAADIGSFNNAATADVVRDFQSALSGSAETLTKYGINVKQAAIQQEALDLGLIKTKKEMTDNIRAQALLSIATRQSSDAIGDMARTSDSYANQLKKAQANISDITTALGEKLLPIATEYITKFNEWIDSNQELIDQQIEVWGERVADAFTLIGEAISFLIDNKEWIAVYVTATTVLPKAAATAQLLSTEIKALSLSAKGAMLTMGPLTAGLLAFTAAYKAGEWLAMGGIMAEIEEEEKKLAKSTQVLGNMFADISRTTGVSVSNMRELDKAVADGKLKYDEMSASWVKGAGALKDAVNAADKNRQSLAESAAEAEKNKTALSGTADSQGDLNAETLAGIDAMLGASTAQADMAAETERMGQLLQDQSVYMGDLALAEATSKEGMEGYKTALELAYGATDDFSSSTDSSTESVIAATSAVSDLNSNISESSTLSSQAADTYFAAANEVNGYESSLYDAVGRVQEMDNASLNLLSTMQAQKVAADALKNSINSLAVSYNGLNNVKTTQAGGDTETDGGETSGEITPDDRSSQVSITNNFNVSQSRSDVDNIVTRQQNRYNSRI